MRSEGHSKTAVAEILVAGTEPTLGFSLRRILVAGVLPLKYAGPQVQPRYCCLVE